MTRHLCALSLSLVLLLAQQLGALHLLSHVLQPAAAAPVLAPVLGHAPATGDVAQGTPADANDAGDALCQVCLVLATLAAASLPAAWGWLARQVRAAAPRVPAQRAPARPAPAPYRARGPPAWPARN